MKGAKRDEFGHLDVPDDDLAALGLGIAMAASLSTEAIQRLFKCDQWEAEAFTEAAHADLSRVRILRRGA